MEYDNVFGMISNGSSKSLLKIPDEYLLLMIFGEV